MKKIILGMQVNVTSIGEVIEKIHTWTKEIPPVCRYVCVANVHMTMKSFDDEAFRQVVNQADLAVPDGRPLVWGQKILGAKVAQQVRGQDLMLEVCRLAAEHGIVVGLYGSTKKVLDTLITVLLIRHPNLKIGYSYSPPFRPLSSQEDCHIINEIRTSGVRILFVGLGCPKQELWMPAHKESLDCIMLGVGAAFDFVAGNKRTAPRWIRKLSLEWLFRLLNEPRRLWKRYVIQNLRFIWFFMKQVLNVLKYQN